MTITLRPAAPDDEGFLRAVYGSTRADELALVPWTDEQKEEFASMQFNAQTTYYREVFPDMEYAIILLDGVAAGRFMVVRRAGEIRLVDVALLPAYRGLGIGKQLLMGLIGEARRTGSPVLLHVEQMNRARNLYDRLGFVPVEEKGVYTMMAWRPDEHPEEVPVDGI